MSNTRSKLKFFELPISSNNSIKFFRTDILSNIYATERNYLHRLRFHNRTWHVTTKQFPFDDDAAISYELIQVFEINEQKDLVVTAVKVQSNLIIQLSIYDDNDIWMKCVFNKTINRSARVVSGSFYADSSRMGAIIVEENGKSIQFYEIVQNDYGDDVYKFEKITTNSDIIDSFCPNRLKIRLVQMKKNSKRMLISINSDALCVFDFDFADILEGIMKIPLGSIEGEDKLFFPNLGGHLDWMDIVVFNSSGLFIFSYNHTTSIYYNQIAYNPMFAAEKGWTKKHTETVQFEDIDNDGCDNFIFTGPAGIEILSYDFYKNEWLSLLNTASLTPQERHSKIIHVPVPLQQEQMKYEPMIFSRHRQNSRSKIYWAKIVEVAAETQKIPPINQRIFYKIRNSTEEIVPKIKTQSNQITRTLLYLRDRNIWLQQTESINPETGKPNLILPLVSNSRSKMNFHLFYDERSRDNVPFGTGWSSSYSFIALNFHNGIFEEEENYVLVTDGTPYSLELLVENSSSMMLVFQLNMQSQLPSITVNFDNSKFRAEFDLMKNIWKIDYGNGRKEIYGSYQNMNIGAVITDSAWKNWRGSGFDKGKTVERTNKWYLAQEKYDEDDILNYFEYEVIRMSTSADNSEFASNTFAYLKRIHGRNDDLIFFYDELYDGDGNEEEDENKFYVSNQNSTVYLRGYTYRTIDKEQTVFFKYRMADGDSLLLISLNQKFDYAPFSVVEFKYYEQSKAKYALKKIILPNDIQIVYEYTSVGGSIPINEENGRRVPVSDDYNVSYGIGFTLISYLDKALKQVILRMFNNEITKEIYPVDGRKAWAPVGTLYKMESYEILIGDNFLGFILYNSPFKSVCLFGRKKENNDWMTKPICYDYSEETIILKGTNYILISDPELDVFTFEWMQDKWQNSVTLSNHNIAAVRGAAIHGNKFVVYDDHQIYFGYKDIRNIWIVKRLVNIPGYLNETKATLMKFNLNENFEKAIFGFFKNNVIQLTQNLIVLNSLVIHNNQKFQTKIKTYVIGRNYEVVLENETFVDQDDFSQLISEEETNAENMKYTLKYIYNNDKFSIELNSLIFQNEPREDSNARSLAFAKKIRREMNFPEAKRFLLDLKNYFVSLRDSTMQCRNVRFSFGGVNWHRSQIERNAQFSDRASISLGNRLLINKTDVNSNVKLYNRISKEILFDFGVKKLKEIQICYPIYLASQKKGESLTVIEFPELKEQFFGFTNTTMSRSKVLSPFGNAISMVTHETDSQGNNTLIIYPFYGMRRLLPNFVISTQTIVVPVQKPYKTLISRVIGYKYDESSAQYIHNQIHYGRIFVMPGNNKKAYGYLKVTEHFTEFFNGEDKTVKRVPHKKNEEDKSSKREENNIEDIKDTIIYDKKGRYEITRFTPFNTTCGMVGFIGFEDYELSTNYWTFNHNNIIRNRFSLTGQNYLQLNDEPLIGTFKPKFQDQEFLASCWIRTPIERIPTLGDIIPHLRASILTPHGKEKMSFLGDVKFQIGDWSYLEVFLDLEFVHLTLNFNNKSHINNLQVVIKVSPLKTDPISVDNVRFAPISSNFDVNVYDNELTKQVAIIKSNGPIIRYIYDEYQVKIGEVDESNQIKEFSTYTKESFSTGNSNNPMCIVTLRPERGFYEDFSPFTFYKQWILDNIENWEIAPTSLYHHGKRASNLLLNSDDISQSSYGFRVLYSLKPDSFISVCGVLLLQQLIEKKIQVTLFEAEMLKQTILHDKGEILFLKEGKRVILWINGKLFFDQHSNPTNKIELSISGEVQLQHMMVFSRPKIQVTYKNALNEVIQEISLISADTVVITEQLYDELGRQRINLQPVEVTRNSKQSIMSYDYNLVINKYPKTNHCIWQTGQLEGKVSDLLRHKYGFSEIAYDNNPLNIKTLIGRPGELFTATGPYAIHFNTTTTNSFILNEYPIYKMFRYQIKIDTPGSEKITVFDRRNLIVASYIVHNEKGGKNSLTTFEYNDEGMLVKFLPPMFHEKINKMNSSNETSGDFQTEISNRYEHLYQKLATIIDYDNRGNPIRKATPDTGLLENIYDEQDRIRFVIQYSRDDSQTIEIVTYFLYNPLGKLISTGRLKKNPSTKDNLLKLAISEENVDEFQFFYPSYSERDPAFRGKIERIVTKYPNSLLYEETIYDNKGTNVISKRCITPNGSDVPWILSINKRYERGLLKEILYPVSMFGEPFRIVYEYDRLGRMISGAFAGQTNQFMTIRYNANNQITTKTLTSPNSNKTIHRIFHYNEAGFLIKIGDLYLSEEISYTNQSFTGKGYGDGKVTRIKFNAKWHKSANIEDGIGLKKNSFKNRHFSSLQSKRCFHELKKKGYLDANNKQTRIFYSDLDVSLSFTCSRKTRERRIKQVMGRLGFPEEYGFKFDYGDQVTLRYAKYFVGKSEPKAFQAETFAEEISGIDTQMSHNIWNLLKSQGYIIESDKLYGKPGKSIIHKKIIEKLTSVNPVYEQLSPLINKLLISQFANPDLYLSNEFVKRLVGQWLPIAKKYPHVDAICEILLSNDYKLNPLEPDFLSSLKDYEKYIHEIVRVMQKYLAMTEKSEYDMELIKIDANGNRHEFYSGFEKYFLLYEADSNRIQKIYYQNEVKMTPEEVFEIRHDSRGNVVQALHKGIKMMKYHPVSNCLHSVEMTNGKKITFIYDSKGERISKRSINNEGEKISETHYLRDENGRTLLEKKITYIKGNQNPDILVTMYIYGAKSLIAFVRRDQFYNVITDHQGSVRLIVRDGEIVAAYDYMPYGNIMRIYGNNPNAHIPYRYTGQEWDYEIGLYNYHARLYDPSLGRFYQVDPVTEYSSPYVYVYNSPVSMVDPSGKMPWWLVLGPAVSSGILGGYLYGANANNKYNPVKWNFSSRKTQLAILMGVIVGVTLPTGFGSSIAALSALTVFKATALVMSLGVTLAYLNVAASHADWNPVNWDYKSPQTWNAMFEGLSTGVGLIGGLQTANKILKALKDWKKYVAATSIAIYGTQSFFTQTNEVELDLKKPEFWLAVVTSISTSAESIGIVQMFRKFIKKHRKSLYKHWSDMDNLIVNFYQFPLNEMGNLQLTAKNLHHIFRDIAKTGGSMTMGATSFTFVLFTIGNLMSEQFRNWDFSQLSDYHHLLPTLHLTGTIFQTSNELILVGKESILQYQISFKMLSDKIRRTKLVYAGLVSGRGSRNWLRRKVRAFDLNESPKAVFTYKCLNCSFIYMENNYYTNPLFKLANNSIIEDNLHFRLKISACLSHIQKVMVARKREILCQKFPNSTTKNAGLFTRDLCDKTIGKLYAIKAYNNDREYIKDQIGKIPYDNEEIHKIKEDYLSKENELLHLVNVTQALDKFSFGMKSKLLTKQRNLRTYIKNLKRQEIMRISDQFDSFSNVVWTQLNAYLETLIRWKFTNIAEPPSFLLSSQSTHLKYTPNPNAYDYNSYNFINLSSYKLNDLPELYSFDKCYNCINATTKTRDIVQDMEWLTLLNANYLLQSTPSNTSESTDVPEESMIVNKRNKRSSKAFNLSSLEDISAENRPAILEKIFPVKYIPKTIERSSLNSDGHYKRYSGATYNDNILEIGDNYLSKLGSNETLLLFETILAKLLKKKFFKPLANVKQSNYKTELFACEIHEWFENSLRNAAKVNKIGVNRLDTSRNFELFKTLIELINQKEYTQIPFLLRKYALIAIPQCGKNKNCSRNKRRLFQYWIASNYENVRSKINQILLN